MTPEQLAYWIQGMLEYTDISKLTEEDLRNKLQGIKDHTATVFEKITPAIKKAEKIASDRVSPEVKKKSEEITGPDYEKIFREAIERNKDRQEKRIFPWPNPTPYFPRDPYFLSPYQYP